MGKGERPDFSVRAKVGEIWITVGAAWNSRNDTISLRLNTMPVGKDWDGSLLLVKPREEDGA